MGGWGGTTTETHKYTEATRGDIRTLPPSNSRRRLHIVGLRCLQIPPGSIQATMPGN